MNPKLWMSAAASAALLLATTGCNGTNAGNTAGDAARTVGRTAGQAAGMAGDAVQRGANAVGGATGRGLDAAGRAVQRGTNAVGDVTGLGGIADRSRPDLNRAGTDVIGGPGAMVTPRTGTLDAVHMTPTVDVNNASRTVTVQVRNPAASLAVSNPRWRTGGNWTNAWRTNSLDLVVPTGWTVRVNNTSPGYGHVAVGIIPYATAASAANGAMSRNLTVTMPGRYHIVAQSPGRSRHIIGTVSVMPAAPSVRVTYG